MDKVTRQCPETHNLSERERRAEAASNRGPSVYQPKARSLTGRMFVRLNMLRTLRRTIDSFLN